MSRASTALPHEVVTKKVQRKEREADRPRPALVSSAPAAEPREALSQAEAAAFMARRGFKPLTAEQIAEMDAEIERTMQFTGGNGMALLPALAMLGRKMRPTIKEMKRGVETGAFEERVYRQWLTVRHVKQPQFDRYEDFVANLNMPEGFDRANFRDLVVFSRLIVRSIESSYGYAGIARLREVLTERILGTIEQDERAAAPSGDDGNVRKVENFALENNKRATLKLAKAAGQETAALANRIAREPQLNRALKNAQKNALERRQQEQEARMPGATQEPAGATTIKGAQRETTRRRYGKSFREGRRSIAAYLDDGEADALKAIAAANQMGVTEYAEAVLRADIQKNKNLVTVGQTKLAEPKRYRSRAAALEEENRQLKHQLRTAKPQ